MERETFDPPKEVGGYCVALNRVRWHSGWMDEALSMNNKLIEIMRLHDRSTFASSLIKTDYMRASTRQTEYIRGSRA